MPGGLIVISRKAIVWLIPSICLAVGCDTNSAEPLERSYEKAIVREADNEFEAILIERAESVYPPRDSVLANLPEAYHSSIPEKDYWYYSSVNGVRVPYAITAEAVAYYENLIDALEADEEPREMTRAGFEYHASVTFYKRYSFEHESSTSEEPWWSEPFERVHVVSLSLRWWGECAPGGPECGIGIRHKRLVVFDEGGGLLRVFLDGESAVAVG